MTNTVDTPPEGQATRPGGWAVALLPEALLLGVSVVFWTQTYAFEQEQASGLGPTFLPRLLIALFVICILARIAQKVAAARSRTPAPAPGAEEQDLSEALVHAEEGAIAEEDWPTSVPYLLIGIALAVGYAFGTVYLGYPLATLLLIVGFVSLAARFTWRALVVALTAALVFPYLFVKVVYIDLPRGVGVFDDMTLWLYGLLGIY